MVNLSSNAKDNGKNFADNIFELYCIFPDRCCFSEYEMSFREVSGSSCRDLIFILDLTTLLMIKGNQSVYDPW